VDSDEPARRLEIQSSVKSIVESSDKWLGRLRTRQFRVRLAISFLTLVLAIFIAAATILGYIVITHGVAYLTTIFHKPDQAGPIAIAIILAGLLSGFATYFLLKRDHNAQLKELSSVIAEMKKIEGERSNAGGEGITEKALSLTDKILTLLPDLVRKRNQDSLVFGIVALILVTTFGGNFAVGILAGVIVWLYFRYETKRTYEQEISKLEEQKRVFEKRKNDFIETL
jgi:hypothetical protein